MALLVAILLALFVLPRPWGYVLVGAAVVYEVVSNWWSWRWSRSRRKVVGAAALIGVTADVTKPCCPDGWVRLNGERWQARCDGGAVPGDEVRVTAVDGLVLVVEPVLPPESLGREPSDRGAGG
jgi:membrane protein implicated in regulation of membrane protease activity